jgi:hypothetical protein
MRKVFALIMVTLWLSPSVFAQSAEERPFWPIWGGGSKSESDWNNSKESSVFNGPSKGEFFQFPQWSAPKWPGVPTFSGLRQQTSRSLRSARYTTRRWWNGTKELLSPFPDDDERETSEENASSWFWWFGRRQEDPEIATVNDFLRQERPRF